jgi:hypothetical protein
MIVIYLNVSLNLFINIALNVSLHLICFDLSHNSQRCIMGFYFDHQSSHMHNGGFFLSKGFINDLEGSKIHNGSIF